MILLDTDVAIDTLRGYPPAVAWLQGLGSGKENRTGLDIRHRNEACPVFFPFSFPA